MIIARYARTTTPNSTDAEFSSLRAWAIIPSNRGWSAAVIIPASIKWWAIRPSRKIVPSSARMKSGDHDQITRENGQIADQRAQLIFFQHQTLNRRKDKKWRPNDQYGEHGALDAPSFIRLDKTQRLFQPERRTAIEDFSVGAICLSHFRKSIAGEIPRATL